jgi:maltose alpha-D-glucosyltransferase/alpha-amylase
MRRLIAVRSQQQTFGRGTIEFVEARNSKVLAYIRCYGDSRILVVANLSDSAQSVELLLSRFAGLQPIDMIGGTPFHQIGAAPYALSLAPFRFHGCALNSRAERYVPPTYRDSVVGLEHGTAASGPPGVAA